MIINNPNEYFVMVRCISCSNLGIDDVEGFRNENTQNQNKNTYNQGNNNSTNVTNNTGYSGNASYTGSNNGSETGSTGNVSGAGTGSMGNAGDENATNYMWDTNNIGSSNTTGTGNIGNTGETYGTNCICDTNNTGSTGNVSGSGTGSMGNAGEMNGTNYTWDTNNTGVTGNMSGLGTGSMGNAGEISGTNYTWDTNNTGVTGNVSGAGTGSMGSAGEMSGTNYMWDTNTTGNTGNVSGAVGIGNTGNQSSAGNMTGTGNLWNKNSMINTKGMNNASNMESMITDLINQFADKIINLTTNANMNQVYKILESVYKSIILAHIKYVPCFAGVKNGTVKGINANQLLQQYLNNFRQKYQQYVSQLNCYENNTNTKVLDETALNKALSDIDTQINQKFQRLVYSLKDMSLDDILKLHILIVKIITSLAVNNIPCFMKAKNGVNGMSLMQIEEVLYDDFRERFYQNVKLLGCDKY